MAEGHSGMTTLLSKESNRQAIEEALSTLTHQCRSRPGLKLRPESCEVRKSKKQKISDGKSYDIFWECRECPGPVPRGGEVQPETKPKEAKGGKKRGSASLKAKRKRESPGPCNVCGKGPDEVKFYPSQKTRCIECMKAAKRSKTRPDVRTAEESSTRIESKEEALSVTAAAKDQNPIEAWPDGLTAPGSGHPDSKRESEVEFRLEPPRFFCEIHGPHSGRMFGLSHSKLCPRCHAEKMSLKMKSHHQPTTMTSADAGSMTVPRWIAEWCAEQAASHGVSPREYLIGQLAREVPSDWIKEWLVKKG